MPKQIDIEIKESESDLRSLLNSQTKLLQHQRAKALLLIKQGKVTYTYELAKNSSVSVRQFTTGLIYMNNRVLKLT